MLSISLLRSHGYQTCGYFDLFSFSTLSEIHLRK
ncbi:hypothetical protein T11_4819 [Trichinella zimbabwensis]|uniref:Uncharacterized protein n=1 Tax=Trichinella zimbabwensis TaxID=268475 RepID=A0A0V1DSX7_9BILA|nr:hypothetical protein T11_4819 [Trichinella zimbabwensis]